MAVLGCKKQPKTTSRRGARTIKSPTTGGFSSFFGATTIKSQATTALQGSPVELERAKEGSACGCLTQSDLFVDDFNLLFIGFRNFGCLGEMVGYPGVLDEIMCQWLLVRV